MKPRTQLTIGLIGGAVAALCCATPVLVVLLGVMGLATWVPWLDFVLIPALMLFGIIAVSAIIRRFA